MCCTFGPYLSASSRKKKKFVMEALNRSGCKRAISIKSNRSRRESRPRQIAFPIFSSHGTLASWTDNMSNVTRLMACNVDSVMSYVGITISNESSLPHHENIGYGPVVRVWPPFFTNGKSPKLTKNSMSGKWTFLTNDCSNASINILNPVYFPWHSRKIRLFFIT